MNEKYVACAIIVDKQNNLIFCCKRGYGEYKGFWEFPGGKVEKGETSEEAVIREIKEELDVDINIESFLTNVNYEYSDFILNMDCFLCTIKNGDIKLLEAMDSRWLDKKDLFSIDWLPADKLIINYLIENKIIF